MQAFLRLPAQSSSLHAAPAHSRSRRHTTLAAAPPSSSGPPDREEGRPPVRRSRPDPASPHGGGGASSGGPDAARGPPSFRGAPSAGRGFGAGGGRGPGIPPKGLSRSQRKLLQGLDMLREDDDDDVEELAKPGSTGRNKPVSERPGYRPNKGRVATAGDSWRAGNADGPADFVVVRPGRPAPAGGAASKARVVEEEEDEKLDGSRFWQEASGWSDADEEEEGEDDGEDEDIEEGEEEVAHEPESAEELQLRELYTTAGKIPARYVDASVKIQAVKGRGRGLVATSALALGQLLLVSKPLGILYCDEGSTPENEELADHMLARSKLSAPRQALLGRLHDGDATKAWTSEGLMLSSEVLDAAAADKSANKPINMAADELYKVVNANCIGEEFQDLAICAIRGEDSLGHIGLWPEAAVINHSCAPNATCFTIGDQLLVRATEDIPAGNEVSLNWVGQLLTAPLQQRRSELREKYGFTCECKRCKAEAGLAGTPLEVAVLSTYERCQELAPKLEASIEASNGREIASVSSELEALRAALEEAMRAAKVSSKLRYWIQASVYDLYDMMSLAADEGAGDTQQAASSGGKAGGKKHDEPEILDTERLSWCVRILNQVAKGTDAHIYLAAELMMRTINKFGEQHQEALSAAGSCKESYRARYGPISSVLFEELAAARLGVS